MWVCGWIACLALDAPAAFAPAEFQRHVAYLAADALEGRGLGSLGNAKAADYMKAELAKLGLQPLGGDWFQGFQAAGKPCRNVLGVLPGAGALANEAVLVSAHHDHLGTRVPDPARPNADRVHNGADDNASGCAGLLLVAAALAQEASPPANRRAVAFVSFDAEEAGLLGSRWYCQHPRWPLDRTAANVNFDMIGRLARDRVYAFDCRSNPLLLAAAEASAKGLKLRLETRLGGTARADHENFLAREIPAVHFSTGLHADYHQPGDETAKLDHAGGARVARLAYDTVAAARAAPQRLAFVRPPEQIGVAAALGMLLKIGIVPETAAQPGARPRLKFVLPGSRAAQRGLRAGDELEAFDGAGFERPEDLVAMLGAHDWRKELKLRVRRGTDTAEVVFPAGELADLAKPAPPAKAAPPR